MLRLPPSSTLFPYTTLFRSMAAILPQVLEILVCPAPECRSKLTLEADRLACRGCGRRYRIEQNWPVLIPEEAEPRSEEHTSELQSQSNLVCRLLLEKKKKKK